MRGTRRGLLRANKHRGIARRDDAESRDGTLAGDRPPGGVVEMTAASLLEGPRGHAAIRDTSLQLHSLQHIGNRRGGVAEPPGSNRLIRLFLVPARPSLLSRAPSRHRGCAGWWLAMAAEDRSGDRRSTAVLRAAS